MSLHPHLTSPFRGEELYEQVTRLIIIAKRCYPMKTRISLTKSAPAFCLTGLMAVFPAWLGASSRAYAVSASSFGGLGRDGLITVIVVAVLLISAVTWIVHGTKRRG